MFIWFLLFTPWKFVFYAFKVCFEVGGWLEYRVSLNDGWVVSCHSLFPVLLLFWKVFSKVCTTPRAGPLLYLVVVHANIKLSLVGDRRKWKMRGVVKIQNPMFCWQAEAFTHWDVASCLDSALNSFLLAILKCQCTRSEQTFAVLLLSRLMRLEACASYAFWSEKAEGLS